MVRFQKNALIIEIPCESTTPVDCYQDLQVALCAVSWLVAASGTEAVAVQDEMTWLSTYFSPALCKLAPEVRTAIDGIAPNSDPLDLSFEQWKAQFFPALPNKWAMPFWLQYQKENNGPYAEVGPNEAEDVYERDRLIEQILDQADKRDTAYLREVLSSITTPKIQ